MDEASIIHAAERIEAALSRIETAARRTADLHQRHQDLKSTLVRSLADLDQLLALAETGGKG